MAEAPDRYCGNCGRELRPEDQFCPNCGRPVHRTATVPTPEADVPVPPPPQAGGAEGGDAAAVQAPPPEGGGRRRTLVGWLTIIGVFAFLILFGGCLAGLAALAGSGGENKVADGGEKNKGSGKGKDTTPKPELAISSPSGSPTVTKDTIEVKGKVTPASSKVAVNGQEVTLDDGSFSVPVHLNVGENPIKITAEKGSEQAEASRWVTRKYTKKEIAAQEAAEEAAAKKEAAEEAAAKKAAEEAAARKAAERAARYASVGDTVRVGDVEWKVTDAFLTNQLKSSFGTQKRGRFVVVDVTFTNNRDEEVTLDPELHMVLKDSSGREFGTDPDAYEFMPVDLDIFLEPVNPGVSTNGRVVYQVPADANGFTLKLDDVEFFEDKSAVFDLSNIPLQPYDSASASASATASPGP